MGCEGSSRRRPRSLRREMSARDPSLPIKPHNNVWSGEAPDTDRFEMNRSTRKEAVSLVPRLGMVKPLAGRAAFGQAGRGQLLSNELEVMVRGAARSGGAADGRQEYAKCIGLPNINAKLGARWD